MPAHGVADGTQPTVELCNTANRPLQRLVRAGLTELDRAIVQADKTLPRFVRRELERAGCRWMVGGSIATSSYGEPRATHDVDLVANLTTKGVGAFLAALGPDFYVDPDTARDADAGFGGHGLDSRVTLDIGGGRVVR